MNASKPILWTKDFILMTLVNFLMASGSFILIPTLPVYAERILKTGKSEIGYIIGIYTLSALFIRPFVGVALDNIGRRPVYLMGLFFFFALMPLHYFAKVFWLLIALRLLHGFTWGITTTGGSTVVSDLVPPVRRGEGIGYYGMSFTVSMAVGPVFGLWLIKDGNYSALFFFSSLTLLFTFLIALFIQYPKIQTVRRSFRITAKMLYDAKGIPSSILAMVCSGVYGGLVTFITLYSQELEIRNGGWFFVCYAIGLTIIRPFAGVEMDTNGPRRIIIFGLVTLIAGLLLLASVTEIIGFLTASFICGVGMGVIMPTTLTMVVNLIAPERRGVGNSTFFSSVDLGVGVGSILLGILAEMTSIRVMYYVSAGIIFLPLLLFLFYVLADYEKKLKEIKSDTRQFH